MISLEQQVLGAKLEGIVLRYGKFYGPGTGFDVPPEGGPLHVDAAADAARRALTRGRPGTYNVAEDDGTVSIRKATDDPVDVRIPDRLGVDHRLGRDGGLQLHSDANTNAALAVAAS